MTTTYVQKTFTTSTFVESLPAGSEVIVQTSADLTIAFWNPVAGAYGSATTIVEPGDVIICPHQKALITTATSASINILSA